MTTANPILGSLNEKQREAVTAVDGPVLIIAGAGSGKTKALTHRVAYLLSGGIMPENILAVTFTNKAADEMKTRIAALVGSLKPRSDTQGRRIFSKESESLFIGTFHSLCANILRKECSKIGFQKNFTIFDDDDSLSLLKEIMKELNISPKQYPAGMIAHIISGLKDKLMTPEEYAGSGDGEIFHKTVSKIYNEYQARLARANAFDFDDLIMGVVRLFREKQDVLEKYQNRFTHIHVDEFQDTNASQYLLINLLAKKHGNIFVIGDDAQSIYSWRGADWRNIFNFEKDWPAAKVVFLEQNYRSTKTILAAANGLIAHNRIQKEKNLWTDNAAGNLIDVIPAAHDRHEAQFVAEEILRLTKEENRGPSDFAILYRTNAQSRAIEEAMLEASLPYVIIGGIKFFQRKEVKDIIAYLRVLQNPADHVSLKRIINLPPRGIGRVSFLNYISGASGGAAEKEKIALGKFEKLTNDLRVSSTSLPPSQFIKTLIKKIRYREYLDDGTDKAAERWENIQEFVSLASRFDKHTPKEGIERLLEDIALVAYDETATPAQGEKISLMTMHAAKGLEFPIVFITGLEEGIFPHSKSIIEPSALEEERRLCYVGITRAKEKLYILWTFERTLFGERQANIPSRFIKEIPETCLEVPKSLYEADDEHGDDTFVID